jgi:hypothetical protein
MIEQAAFCHACERQRRHVKGFHVGFGTASRATPMTQHSIDAGRMGKFRRVAEAAIFAVEILRQRSASLGERIGRETEVSGRRRRVELCKELEHALALRPHIVPIPGVMIGDFL